MHIHIHIHMHTYTYIHTYIHLNIHTHTHTYKSILTNTHVRLTSVYRRVGQQRAATDHFSAIPPPICERLTAITAVASVTSVTSVRAESGSSGLLRTTSRRFPHLSARFAEAVSAKLADRCGKQLPCRGFPTYLRGLTTTDSGTFGQQRAATDHISADA